MINSRDRLTSFYVNHGPTYEHTTVRQIFDLLHFFQPNYRTAEQPKFQNFDVISWKKCKKVKSSYITQCYGRTLDGLSLKAIMTF